ncbi:hypothetical protein CXB51_017235 [Gossypium anomalum]|nr:hypothetical protein CXB51_017235 [Gossypium anomalum]
MIYDVNSPLFRSFLSQKGGSSDKRKMEEQKPKEQRPKANENKPVMTEDIKSIEKSKVPYSVFQLMHSLEANQALRDERPKCKGNRYDQVGLLGSRNIGIAEHNVISYLCSLVNRFNHDRSL